MVTKKGIFRIIEATISVLVIISVILIINQTKGVKTEKDLNKEILTFLDIIAKNSSIRENVFLNEDKAKKEIKEILLDEIDPVFNFSFSICKIKDLCTLSSNYPKKFKGGIYSKERVISSYLDSEKYEPKKIKIFLWRKA